MEFATTVSLKICRRARIEKVEEAPQAVKGKGAGRGNESVTELDSFNRHDVWSSRRFERIEFRFDQLFWRTCVRWAVPRTFASV